VWVCVRILYVFIYLLEKVFPIYLFIYRKRLRLYVELGCRAQKKRWGSTHGYHNERRVGIPPNTFFWCKDKFNFPSMAKACIGNFFISIIFLFPFPLSSHLNHIHHFASLPTLGLPNGLIILHFELNQLKS